MFFLHGFSDHSNIHHELFPILASRGIQVVSYDQRGYGKSVKDKASRGVSGTTATVLADITSIIEPYLTRTEAPIFLMGHSMGGAEILYYAARGPIHVRQRIRGYISEAPWIGLHEATQPNRLIVFSGRLISKILPHQQRLVDLDPKLVSRDPAVGEAFLADELCHSTGTLEGLAGCLQRADQLRNGEVTLMDDLSGNQPPISLLLAHGTADGITSFKASKTFMEKAKVKDKDFRVYEGWYHKRMSMPLGLWFCEC